jgi:2-methylcitrate dehydratase
MADEILSRFANFATKLTFGDLPSTIVEASKNRLLDTLGCAVAARGGEAPGIGRMLAGPPAPGSFSGYILGERTPVAADAAAFATACMIRDLDLNDDYPGGHPSDALGAILAVAPAVAVSGERLVVSVVVAYETVIALLKSVPLRDLGWDQSIAIGVGATAGLANLLGMDGDTTRHALSIAAVSNTALRATRAGELSMWKGAATAHAVRNAVFSVQLARAGMTGPEAPFTGRHGLMEMISGRFELPPLGGETGNYRIPDVYTKCWPVAYSLQAVVWAGIELRKRLDATAIDGVTVSTYEFSARESGSEPAKWDPKTRETADHSIPYVLARALLFGTIDHETFKPEAYLDPAIRPLMSKVTVQADEGIERKIRRNVVELRLEVRDTDGNLHHVTIENPLGHELNPLPPAEMAARFERLCRPVLGNSASERALAMWSNIEASSNVTDAFQALAADA